MKEKLFAKLKQAYSPLGLGDIVLQAQAESLATLGFVTDENIDAVVEAAKPFLEGLQKNNDKRVTEARAKAKEEAKKEFEEETKKREEEKRLEAERKAKEEAERKAAEEAERKAKEEAEAARKAKEEAERKAKEELKKNTEIPDWYKEAFEKAEAKAKEREESYQKLIANLQKSSDDTSKRFEEIIKGLQTKNEALQQGYDSIKKENEDAKAAAKLQAHKNFILSEAKRLGVPQYRIDEGFNLSDDAEESAITEYLTKVATNIKVNQLPDSPRYQLGNDKPTKEEVDKLVAGLIKK